MQGQPMERTMMRAAAAALLAFGAAMPLGLSVGPVLAGVAPGLHSRLIAGSQVEPVDYRRCWASDGKRHCRWVPSSGARRDDNAVPAYGASRPENYRVGTAEWYRAMERDGRLSTEGGSP
jgi:hypothetical protein